MFGVGSEKIHQVIEMLEAVEAVPYRLGVDLGGTNIAIGLVDSHGAILAKDSIPTNAPRPTQALCDDIAAVCIKLLTRMDVPIRQILHVGVGSPGILWDGTIIYANNLRLSQAPIASLLQERLNLPVYLHGDGNAAAYGEYLMGAAQNSHSMVMVTLGTGIGGGIILDGKIQCGFNGAASELGHFFLYPGGRLCTCGHHGCFEAYCSATGLIQSTREAMQRFADSKMWEICPSLEKIDGKTAFDAMHAGDAAATSVVNAYITDLSYGLSSIVNLLQPEVLCMGGGVAREGEGLLAPLRKKVAEMSWAGHDNLRTNVVAAALGNDAGIVGAALMNSTCY